MSDKYGYIGLETLLNFCSNDKNHCVTPNDFMRMDRVKIDERPHGEWIDKGEYAECSICGANSGTQFDGVEPIPLKTNFCPNCGSNNRPKEGEKND